MLLNLTDAGQVAETAAGALRDLPVSAHAVIAGAFLGGLVLWAFGRRSLRLAFVLLGVIGGALIGLFGPPALGVNVEPHLPTLACAVAGLVAGLFLFRLVIALSLALLLGVLTPMIVVPAAQPALDEHGELHAPLVEAAERAAGVRETLGELEDLARTAAGGVGLATQLAEPRAPEAVVSASKRLRSFVVRLAEAASPYWDSLDGRGRMLSILSALGGGALGFSLGMFVHRKAAVVVTAGGGAAIVLVSGVWMATAAGLRPFTHLPDTPAFWVSAWALFTLAGMGIQWRRPLRRTDNA